MNERKNKLGYIKNKLAIVGLAALVAGCSPSSTMNMKTESEIETGSEIGTNYTILRVGVFKDDLAYKKLRGIYEIVDNKTGKTYIGISGIGICETGSHSSGKTSVEDER